MDTLELTRKRSFIDRPPEAIKRWARVKAGAKGAALARALMRYWLPLKERRRSAALKETVEAVRRQAARSERNGYQASLVIENIALYFLIAERDIQSLKIEALTHKDEWTRKLCARVILLTIHEWDMDKVAGRTLTRALDDIQAPVELRNPLIVCLREIRKVQAKARAKFDVIRNSTIAHRDADALLQYRTIRDLQVKEVFGIAEEFYSAAGNLTAALGKLIVFSNSLPSLLRQLKH